MCSVNQTNFHDLSYSINCHVTTSLFATHWLQNCKHGSMMNNVAGHAKFNSGAFHLIQTLIFEQGMVGYGSKNTHQKDMCWKREWITCSKSMNHSRHNSPHKWGPYIINWELKEYSLRQCRGYSYKLQNLHRNWLRERERDKEREYIECTSHPFSINNLNPNRFEADSSQMIWSRLNQGLWNYFWCQNQLRKMIS